MRTPSVRHPRPSASAWLAALTLALLCVSTPGGARASRAQIPAATTTAATAQEQQSAQGTQQQETTQPQGTAAATRFGRGPALVTASGADATSAEAMASHAEKLRAWWRQSAAAVGSCASTLRRRFQRWSADVSAAKDDVSAAAQKEREDAASLLEASWQAYAGELEDAVLGTPEHGERFHQVKMARPEPANGNKGSPTTATSTGRSRWSIQLLVRRSHVSPHMPLSSLGRQDGALQLGAQEEVELANPSEAWHRYASEFTD